MNRIWLVIKSLFVWQGPKNLPYDYYKDEENVFHVKREWRRLKI